MPDYPDRLFILDRGRHAENMERACVMEAASWLSGEPWSDHPRSVHPIIAQVARTTNDELDDEARQALWPLVLASIGTARPWGLRLHFRLAKTCRVNRALGSRELWEALLVAHKASIGEQEHHPVEVSTPAKQHSKERPLR